MKFAGIGLTAWAREAPARYQFCQCDHIVLDVAPVDAERVKLEYLTCQIFVEPATKEATSARTGADRLRIVEVEGHRRMLGGGKKHIGETSGDMRPDHFTFEGTGQARDDGPSCRHGEVIAPEHHQTFMKRDIARYHRLGARGDLADVDLSVLRAKELLNLRCAALLRRVKLQQVRRRWLKTGKLRRQWLQHRELLVQPPAWIRGNRRHIPATGAEAKAIGSNISVRSNHSYRLIDMI